MAPSFALLTLPPPQCPPPLPPETPVLSANRRSSSLSSESDPIPKLAFFVAAATASPRPSQSPLSPPVAPSRVFSILPFRLLSSLLANDLASLAKRLLSLSIRSLRRSPRTYNPPTTASKQRADRTAITTHSHDGIAPVPSEPADASSPSIPSSTDSDARALSSSSSSPSAVPADEATVGPLRAAIVPIS
jgi:hypothetical protein